MRRTSIGNRRSEARVKVARRRPIHPGWFFVLLVAVVLFSLAGQAVRAADSVDTPAGLHLLLHEPLSLSPLVAADLDDLWRAWPEAQRAAAEAATPEERRRLTFRRYGMIARDGIDDSGLPLGYASDADGNLYPNCLSCHGGEVAGQVIPGIGNTDQDLTLLVEDLAALRALRSGGDADAARSFGTFGFPLNFTRGSTNATMYSILLGAMRDQDLNQVMPPRLAQPFVHNTIDPPPWWHFHKKRRIYWDGMAPKTVRTLMQFTMAPGLSGEKIRSWEDEFAVIRDYIDSLEAPEYPFEIDQKLAAQGEQAFRKVCSRCHGSYGENETYPNRVVPIDELGTDPVRLGAIRPESKEKYNGSWFADYGEHPVTVDVKGYVAPPLDGIWATAPYFHNASVPTLWHVLHPDDRPTVWRKQRELTGTDGYDRQQVGLRHTVHDEVPEGLEPAVEREYYDTDRLSQSAAGHRFPLELSETERRAVLEYLKTL